MQQLAFRVILLPFIFAQGCGLSHGKNVDPSEIDETDAGAGAFFTQDSGALTEDVPDVSPVKPDPEPIDEPQHCGSRGSPTECGAHAFCKFTQNCGADDSGGTCELLPDTCTTQDALTQDAAVCGCDGVTYANECIANAQGISVREYSRCDAPVCRFIGSNSEGWYYLDGTFICFAACSGSLSRCDGAGTRSEGWYTDDGAECLSGGGVTSPRMITWANCDTE